MILNEDLKKRFCRDSNISLQVYEEPYFSQRIELLGLKGKYDAFENFVNNNFNGNAELYLKENDLIRDRIIDYIKSSSAFIHLNATDMRKFATIGSEKFKDGDVYRQSNVGQTFLSIDLKQANFSSLVHYARTNSLAFFQEYDYKKFMEQFTTMEHFIESKYIRQVVFGNCNPKRQVAYEKFLIFNILKRIIDELGLNPDYVSCLCHDEIVIKATLLEEDLINKIKTLATNISKNSIPLHYEKFILGRIVGTNGFVKRIQDSFDEENEKDVLKCLTVFETMCMKRRMNGQDILEDDLVFSHEKVLAKPLNSVEIIKLLNSIDYYFSFEPIVINEKRKNTRQKEI